MSARTQVIEKVRSLDATGDDLATRIFNAERAVIQRDERVVQRMHDLTERLRRGTRHGVGVGLKTVLAVGAASVALSVMLRRAGAASRRQGPAPAVRMHAPRAFATVPWGRLLPLMWALMPGTVRRRVNPRLASSLLALLGMQLAGRASERPAVIPAAQVDLRRYMGRWHEVARMPYGRERDCAGDATATYARSRRGDTIEVMNRCRLEDGEEALTLGVAREVPGSRGAKLKVCFAPGWLRWLPMVWADYWILDVDAQYRSALVGTPDRSQLWVLSRTPRMSEVEFRRLIELAREEGYDVDRVEFTPQPH